MSMLDVRGVAWQTVLTAAQSAAGLNTARELLAQLPAGDPRAAILDLYLPICSATAEHPITVGHLGQSLDGFIATHAGESRYVTGQENIVHLHRLRAICHAVVVGARTVYRRPATDNAAGRGPQSAARDHRSGATARRELSRIRGSGSRHAVRLRAIAPQAGRAAVRLRDNRRHRRSCGR